MKGVTKAMMNMNKQMKLPEIQKIMQEFEKQSEIMDMKEEMMSDVIDDALGDEDDEEESDAIVTQVLDELGLQMTDQITGLPVAGGSVAVSKDKAKAPGEDCRINDLDLYWFVSVAAAAGEAAADADLEERLNNLRRE